MNDFINNIKDYFKTIIPNHKEDFINKFLKVVMYTNKLGVTYLHYDQFLLGEASYKLYKALTPNMLNVIKKPKKLDKNKYQEITLSQLNKQYEQDVLTFVKTLENNFSKEQLLYMYKNLKKLVIETKPKLSNGLGRYNTLINKIKIESGTFSNTVMHELFHMATTINTVNETHSGFLTHISFLELGRSINEGYTEIMTNRYFHYSIDNSGYAEQIILCKELEDIVGKEKMEQLYIGADLNGLIKELSKYAKTEDVINFIKAMDEILTISNKVGNYKLIKPALKHMTEIMNTKKIEVNLFLDTIKKRKQQNNNGLMITNKDYKSLYTVNNKSYKKLYLQCLTLLHYKNNIELLEDITQESRYYYEPFYTVEKIFDIIDYDKLENICYNGGIKLLIEELKKYLDDETIYQYLDSLNDNMIDFKIELDLANKLNKVLEISKKSNGSIKMPFNCGFNFQNDCFNILYFNNIIKAQIDKGERDEILHSLESTIGKERLYDLFMSGNTTDFINELKKHRSELFANKIIQSQNLFELERNIIQYVHEINLDLDDKNIAENNELYTSSNQQQYPNLYKKLFKCYYIFNQKNFSDREKNSLKSSYIELYSINFLLDVIGYDKLENICYNGGIKFLIEELKKYLNEEDVYSYLELLNKDILSLEEINKEKDYITLLQNQYRNSNLEIKIK